MSVAYYNENDSFAAAWLQQLILADLIAPGVVDTRSIEDVTPNDVRGFTQCHYFAGCGIWSLAARVAGWPDERPLWTGSCPCQPFSAAGKGGGFADERHLWPAFHWLIDQCRPERVVGEQVASRDGLAWLELVLSDLEASGYAFGAVDTCAAGFGAPHIRQRLYWVADSKHDGRGQHRHGVGGTARAGESQSGQRERFRTDLADGGAAYEVGFAGRWKSYAEWFGVCWHPSCRDSDDRTCRCRELGAPAGWHWDDDCGWVADSAHQRHERSRDARGRRDGLPDRSDASGLALPHGGQRDGLADGEGRERDGATAGRQQGDGQPQRSGATGGVDHAAGARHASERCGQSGQPERGRGVLGVGREVDRSGRPGPTNGLWASPDWLRCRDEKWRPVEPGTFPLADAGAFRNRVGLLRGAGNAINLAQAAAFIRAIM